MDHAQVTVESSVDGAVQLLRQILQLYKVLGPQSLASLTKSYLAAAPTAETAADAAEGMMARAFRVFDGAADAVLRACAARQGFDLSGSKSYRRRLEEGYFQVAYPAMVAFMVWLDREGQKQALANLGKFFQSTMLGVAGYMMLDSNLDEHLQRLQATCQSLIDSSRQKCLRLKADLMGYFVDMLAARLGAFFAASLKAIADGDHR